MFESVGSLEAAQLRSLLDVLGRSAPTIDDAERIDRIDLLERLKAVAAAAQARLTADLVESQTRVAEQAEDRAYAAAEAGDFETWRAAREATRAASLTDVTAAPSRARRRRGADIGVQAQVALARQASPSQGSRAVRTALALVSDLPHALAALTRGDLSERRADLLVQETVVLTSEQRRAVDAELADRWGSEVGLLSDREIVRRVRAVCYRIDAASVVARARQAESDRHVSLRPAPDTMTYLTALLPVAQGVAALAALTRAADSARASGDPRGKGQVMADTLVERLTGQTHADAVPVEVQVVWPTAPSSPATTHLRTCPDTAPSPRPGPASSWAGRAHTGIQKTIRRRPCGCAGSTRIRTTGVSCPWTPLDGCSTSSARLPRRSRRHMPHPVV